MDVWRRDDDKVAAPDRVRQNRFSLQKKKKSGKLAKLTSTAGEEQFKDVGLLKQQVSVSPDRMNDSLVEDEPPFDDSDEVRDVMDSKEAITVSNAFLTLNPPPCSSVLAKNSTRLMHESSAEKQSSVDRFMATTAPADKRRKRSKLGSKQYQQSLMSESFRASPGLRESSQNEKFINSTFHKLTMKPLD